MTCTIYWINIDVGAINHLLRAWELLPRTTAQRCWEIVPSFSLTNGFNSTLDGKEKKLYANHHSNRNKRNREWREKDQLIFRCQKSLIFLSVFRLKLKWKRSEWKDDWKRVASHPSAGDTVFHFSGVKGEIGNNSNVAPIQLIIHIHPR